MQLSVVRLLLSAVLATTLTSCGSGIASPFNDSLNSTTIFMGDSITQYWQLPEHNAGVAGQTTVQMLDRFNADVLGHGFKRVVILGGTNDIRLQQSPSTVLLDLDAMGTMAQAAGIEVILCTLPPIPGQNDLRDQVTFVNQEITALVRLRGFQLVDYFTPMAGHPEYFIDGLHPDKLGYAVMETSLSTVVVK